MKRIFGFLAMIILVSAMVPPLTVNAARYPDNMVAVYRFYNKKQGTHFYTASESEAQRVSSRLKSTYRPEGVSYHAFKSGGASKSGLFRFYNRQKGTHFYTISPSESQRVRNSMTHIYRYEGVAYYVGSGGDSRAQAVHRFYHRRQGTHFYTISSTEAQRVKSRLASTYRPEGVAYQAIPTRHFRVCADAWAAGVAPIYRGQPGYHPNRDSDGDGIACEIPPGS